MTKLSNTIIKISNKLGRYIYQKAFAVADSFFVQIFRYIWNYCIDFK